MTSEVFRIDDMSVSKDSGEIYSKLQAPYSQHPISPDALAISWEDVSGVLDGILNIYTGIVGGIKSKAFEIKIDSADNSDDSELILFTLPIETIRIEYLANGITAGKLNAVMNYGGKHAY